MTKKRKLILKILEDAVRPLTAHQIKSILGSKMNITTIYRSLQFFEQNNYLCCFPYDCSSNGLERYYLLKEMPHSHFMHCNNCHKFYPVKKCPLSKNYLKITEKKTGFKIQNHLITFNGLCSNCKKSLKTLIPKEDC